MIDKSVIREFSEEFLKNTSDYLVDVQILPGNNIIVEIDNDEGVNIENCVKLSRYLESKLDRDSEDFELTVTSTGLTSPFKTVRQYQKYIGKEVEALTKKGEKIKGVLNSANDENFTVTVIKMVKAEGAKKKTQTEENLSFSYDEVKYTKYLIRF